MSNTVRVIDASGQELSPCPGEKAERLIAAGKAQREPGAPATIRLTRSIALPDVASQKPDPMDLRDRRVLLHICCAPCATYVVRDLCRRGADVTGYWFNPNIHPFSEHEARRQSLASYAERIGLPMVWEEGYEMPSFLSRIVGKERHGQRCQICYSLRLSRTAETAVARGLTHIATTLAISPYQDLEAIADVGQREAVAHGVAFHKDNWRRGFAESHRLAREAGLYRQHYCGCIYSEWEALDQDAPTRRSRDEEE